jgi:hypothetical protein
MVHGRVRTTAGESWTFEGPDLSTWEAKEGRRQGAEGVRETAGD